MSKPTPGEIYTTIQGDTLESIAGAALGDPNRYTDITDVNPMQITVTSSEQLPTGTSLIIPEDTDRSYLRRQQLQNGLAGVM